VPFLFARIYLKVIAPSNRYQINIDVFLTGQSFYCRKSRKTVVFRVLYKKRSLSVGRLFSVNKSIVLISQILIFISPVAHANTVAAGVSAVSTTTASTTAAATISGATPTSATGATTTGANCGSTSVINVLNSVGGTTVPAPVTMPAPVAVVNQAISDLFKPGQLEKYKLQLGGADGSTLFDVTDPANPVPLGNMVNVDVPFTYEWAETPTHLAWLREHGISNYEMKQDIAAPGQAAGKGYYVSSNPIDSIMYGDGLTVFRPGRPMAILKASTETYNPITSVLSSGGFEQVVNDTASVIRLKNAGVSGFQNAYTKTWFSIIDDSLLKGTSEVNAEYLRDYIKQNSPTDVLNTMLAFETRPWESKLLEKFFPTDHPLSKLLRQEALTPAESVAYAEAILAIPQPPAFNSKEKFYDYLRKKVLAPYLQTKISASDISGLNEVMAFITKTNLDLNAANDLFSRIPGKLTAPQKTYQQIMATTDLYDIATAIAPGSTFTPQTLAALKASATQFAIAQDALKKIKNPSLNDLMSAVKKSTGAPMAFRSEEAFGGAFIVPDQEYYPLERNKFLSVSAPVEVAGTGWNSGVKVSVSYPSVKNYQSFSSLLSPTLLNQLNTMGLTPTADVVAKMNSAISEELVQALLDPKRTIEVIGMSLGATGEQLAFIEPTPSSLYQTFLTIHPFQDHNEVMAKLLFQYADQNLKNPVTAAYTVAANASIESYQARVAEAQKIATLAAQKAATLATPAAQVAAAAQASAALAAANQAAFLAYNASINASVTNALSESIPVTTGALHKNGLPISIPIHNFALVAPDQLASYLRLQPAIMRWVSEASNDQDFISRAQGALNSVVASNPALAQVIPPLPPPVVPAVPPAIAPAIPAGH
jgi:hypothetical protein